MEYLINESGLWIVSGPHGAYVTCNLANDFSIEKYFVAERNSKNPSLDKLEMLDVFDLI